MGTYDTIGGTPRHDTSFDNEPPCKICTRYCSKCKKPSKDCECLNGPECDKKCGEGITKMRMPSGNIRVYW